jgi:hypothetical protein
LAATLFKEVSYTLSKLIEDIDMGEIGLPEIQRPFIWKNSKVRDLFDSMYRGFPVGYLLFWQSIANGYKQIGQGEKQKYPRLLIVDGQQRLTSLFAVLKCAPVLRDDYRAERIRIAFRPKDVTFEVTDAAIEKDAEFLPDISSLWSKESGRKKTVTAFFTRLRERRELSPDEEEQLEEAIDRVYDLQHYPFTALELSGTVGEEEVADVFVRINSKGMTLNQADFILTLMSVFWDEGRKELETFCRAARTPTSGAASSFNYFIQPDPDQLLRVSVALGFRRARLQYVYSLLRGKDLETGEFSDDRRDEQFKVLQQAQSYALKCQNWHEFFKAIMTAGYRSGGMVSSEIGLLYAYALYLIGLRDFHVDHFELRQVIARWYFMTAVTGRYSSSPETTMDQDLARLREAHGARGFVEALDAMIAERFTEDFWTLNLPRDLATSASRGPTLFGYYAALNLVGAKVLFSQMTVHELLDPSTAANKAALERHHLFPKGYLRTMGITDTRETNQVANFALVEWADNIGISDTAPVDYFSGYAGRFPNDELRSMMYWHALPEDWVHMTYADFLAARREGIALVMRDGFARLKGGKGVNADSAPTSSAAPSEQAETAAFEI